MTSRAETPSKKALERLSQPSERCGSVNRICSAFQIARRWEMRSAVSRGRAPPSFFHFKNVERAGEPKGRIWSSVERTQASAMGVTAGQEERRVGEEGVSTCGYRGSP